MARRNEPAHPILRRETDRQQSSLHVGLGLRETGKIVHSANGNRAMRAGKFLRRVRGVLPRIGVSRIADISFLAASRYPVFQSARPNILTHTDLGQNTGAQGKGPTAPQAMLSCMMETVEGYCAEPRNPDLVRATYDFLRHHRLVADPAGFVRSHGRSPATGREPLVWTPAYSIEADAEVLIPAESVFFPFLPGSYHTRSVFPCSSNGLASGATYLEAVIHALYEVIERYYDYRLQRGEIELEALRDRKLKHAGIARARADLRGEFELQLFVLEIPGLRNLPVIKCLIEGDGRSYCGTGCSATVDISIDRAVSEALQDYATTISGSREDLRRGFGRVEGPRILVHAKPRTERGTLEGSVYRKRVHDRRFRSLRDELRFIRSWLLDLGYSRIYAANLTRAGIDLPVVKVIVEGMGMPRKTCGAFRQTSDGLMRAMFPNIPEKPRDRRR